MVKYTFTCIDFCPVNLYNRGEKMMKGLRYMVAVLAEIDKIIESPSKKPSKKEAMKMLRSCGILNKNNGLKTEYKEILIKDVSKKNENK